MTTGYTNTREITSWDRM